MRLRKESLWPDLDSMPVYAAKREGARGKDEDGGRGERATRRRARWWGEQE